MPRTDAAVRYPHSIQRRFFLTLALLLVVSMTLLGAAMLANQHRLMEQRLLRDTEDLTRTLTEKGTASSTFLARIAPQGLLAYDYLLLEGYVEELTADPDIVYAVIFDAKNRPVTHYLNPDDTYFRGRAIGPDTFATVLAQVRHDTSLLRVNRDIDYEGTRLGSVEVALSRTRIVQRGQELKINLQRELRRIALITGALMLISLIALLLLIEWAFRRLVLQPMQLLSGSMASLQAGDLHTRAAVLRDDEIGYLARRFNRMADDLQAQLAQTEQHARAIQETRDYLANILDNSADMIATTAMDGTIVEFNDAAERILGYRRADIVGSKSDIIYCDIAARDRLYATALEGHPVQGTEIQLRRNDGSLVDVELTLSPLHDNQGELIGTVCIGRDVTHAKALRRELIQSEKLASVGQVAAWIAHQIRNYLGRMLMATAALRPAASEPAARHKAHADLSCAIGDLERLVTDLLEYSRTLTLHPTSMKLNAALGALLNGLAAELPADRIRIERAFQADLPSLQVDVFKLEQALTNVLRNAVQAMPDGGLLRVSTRAGAPGTVTATVQDSGPGIAADDADKVFRPFYTTKPGGTGLGLAIARRIVEAHGGTLSVHSTAGAGACFEFILPCAAGAEIAA